MRFKLFFILPLLLIGCSDDPEDITDVENIFNSKGEACQLTNGWLIPPEDVVGGGSGKEGIPSLDNPRFVNVSEVDFLMDDDLAVGIESNGEVRIFPHRIIDRHEIVNDHIGSDFYTVTFCPLTGSTVALNRDETNSVGVTGLLHNSNLIYYDRSDDSFWSQMKLVSVRGNMVCESPDTRRTLEMTWDKWKLHFPNAKVLSVDTGFDRDYTVESFSSVIQKDNVPLWPYFPKDTRLRNYDKVLVIFDGNSPKAYPITDFGSENTIIRDNLLGTDIILTGNVQSEMMAVYYTQGPQSYGFEERNGVPMIVSGNKSWNVFGRAESDEYEDLKTPDFYMAYWFSVGAMFPQIEIYSGDGD